MNDNTLLINFGGAIKAMPSGMIVGKAVVFSGPDDTDREGDFFQSNTYFGRNQTPPLYWRHNMDPNLKGPLGPVAHITLTQDALIAESQLDMSNPVQAGLWNMAKSGALNFSTGSAGHVVNRVRITEKARWIKEWPLVEVSLTPRNLAVEPRAIVSVKSLIALEHEPPEVHQIYLEAKARELYWRTLAIQVKMQHDETMEAIKGWR